MTRHTRNRQLQKLNSVLAFNTTGCNITIELSKSHVCVTDLDPTFKWVRIKLRNGVHNMIFCRDSLDMWTVIVPK